MSNGQFFDMNAQQCLFVGDDNADLLKKTHELFPDGLQPGAVIEHVSKEEPDGA